MAFRKSLGRMQPEGQRQIKVPKSYYEQLRRTQQQFYTDKGIYLPLWQCTEHVALEKHRWRDDIWFGGKKGSLFDMFPVMFIIAVALIVMILGLLFMNSLNTAIQGANVGSAGKQFISTFNTQNNWVLDFLFVMLLISLPLVSAILAYFNNIPPFLFWASIGVVLLVIVLANIISDAYVNITTVSGMQTVTSNMPMTHYIMSHFVIYAFLCCTIIMFGVFIKPRNPYGY